MLQKVFYLGFLFLLIGCGSGLCPLGSAYRTNCPLANSVQWVSPIGALDTSFNGTGIVTTPIGISTDNGYSVVLQPDGKILLGGSATIAGNFDLAIARYHANGSLDTTFNLTGIVTTPIGAGDDAGYQMALQPDGKILLGGDYYNGANYDFAIARYHSNGSLDTTFNLTGFVTTPIGAGSDLGSSLVLQPDGKILLGGDYYNGANYDFAIARYHANGSLDTTFNLTGFVTTAIGVSTDGGNSLVLQSDGKILLGGTAMIGANLDFAIARYHANGSLDTTFNLTGFVTTPIGASTESIRTLVIQPDGKILASGVIFTAGIQDTVTARYHANGSLDTTFNLTGFVITPLSINDDSSNSIALQPDGKILLGGYANVVTNNFSILRYHSDGSLDTTFNGTGVLITPIGVVNDYGSSLALQPDGKIILGGYARIGADDFALVRYR